MASTTDGQVNVKDFGAVGDGSADDSGAIQAAIDSVSTAGTGEANGGCAVLFPNGVYSVGSSITVSASNVLLIGEGPGSRIVRSSGNSDPYTVGFIGSGPQPFTQNSLYKVGMRDIAVGSLVPGAVPQDLDEAGVLLQSAIEFSLSGVYVEHHNGPAVQLVDAFVGQISGGTMMRSMDGVVMSGVCNSVRIETCRIDENRGAGIRFPDSSSGPAGLTGRANGVLISGNLFQSNGGNGIVMTDGIYRGTTIVGNYFEANLSNTAGTVDPRPHGPDEPGHVYKTDTTTECDGIAVIGNNFHPSVPTNLSVAFDSGDSGCVMGNHFHISTSLTPSYGLRLGPDASDWAVNGASTASISAGEALASVGLSEAEEPGVGIVLTSAGGQRFRLDVAEDGSLVTAPV